MSVNCLNSIVFASLPSLLGKTFYRSFSSRQTHYDVLKVSKNCTNKDIKQAYIELTKKFHPDRSKNDNSKLFLQVSEAYKILSKPDLRRDYDIKIGIRAYNSRDFYNEPFQQRSRNPMDDPSFFRNRNRQHDRYYEQEPYYGIRGVNRMPNSIILIACFIFMMVGVSMQFLAIRHSVTFQREHLLYKSALASKNLEQSRKTAEENGNKMQLELLEQKFKDDGNLTVTN